MMQIQRLNMDSSWFFNWEGQQWLIDPWLVGSEIDGFSWLNEQWHSTPPLSFKEIPKVNFILISQSYEDHCHLETLKQVDPQVPILATSKAYKRLKKAFPKRKLLEIPLLQSSKALTFGNLSFYALRPQKILDPIYFGVLIFREDKQAIFYAPHGFSPLENEIISLQNYSFKLLMTTFSDFEIPAIMGGKVNPGLENVKMLAQMLNPRHLLNTHDEAKKMKGLVARLAKVVYPDLEKIQKEELNNLILSPDYSLIELP